MKTLLCIFSIIFCFSAQADQSKFSPVTQTTITASVTSTLVLSANPYREYLLIENLGAVAVIVKFGSAQTGTEGVQIPAGGNYEPLKAPTSSVYIETASSTANVVIIDGV